jgi:hypothetical protein
MVVKGASRLARLAQDGAGTGSASDLALTENIERWEPACQTFPDNTRGRPLRRFTRSLSSHAETHPLVAALAIACVSVAEGALIIVASHTALRARAGEMLHGLN